MSTSQELTSSLHSEKERIAFLLFFAAVSIIVISLVPLLFGFGFTHAEELPRAEPPNVISDSRKTIESTRSHVENEIHCLALNIYFEARSESVPGQRAVGHVVMNRASHPRYPSSVCGVVQQGGEDQLHRCQFSWWCDGRSDIPTDQNAWGRSLRLARMIYLGTLNDTTEGALWYHADYVEPYWSKKLLRGDKIGQHIFYLDSQIVKNTL